MSAVRSASARRARRLPLRRRRARERRRQPAEPDARRTLPARGACRSPRSTPFRHAGRRATTSSSSRLHKAPGHGVRLFPKLLPAVPATCARRSCTRATSRRSRRAFRPAFARRAGPHPRRARARRRRPRRVEPDATGGAPHVPAVRHAVRRAVARPRALPASSASASPPRRVDADLQRCRHRALRVRAPSGRPPIAGARSPIRDSCSSAPSGACRR